MAIICVFDTETISTTEKVFCYNVGYVISDTDSHAVLEKRDFVVEQIWHNTELFETAYYADKKPIYIKAMRKREAIMNKWGYIMGQMIRDFKAYNVQYAYAFNSPFDDRVFSFNCNWFHTRNPFDNVPIFDILGPVSKVITNTLEYKQYCEKHQFLTDAGNYKGTAETVYRFIQDDETFVEDHTALSDSEIETEILLYCLDRGCELGVEYPVTKYIKRLIPTPFQIVVDGETIYSGGYIKKYHRKGLYKFTTI